MTESDIANMALAHLGEETTIAALTEKSKGARACNLFYPLARDECLRDFPWPFATTYATLALVSTVEVDASHPTIEWTFAYRAPADCLMARRIPNGASRVEDPNTNVKWREIRDAEGLLILTDQPEAVLEYTARVTDVGRFPPDFIAALSYKLAYHIALRVAGPDKHKLRADALSLYQWRGSWAMANSGNEEAHDRPAESELITGR